MRTKVIILRGLPGSGKTHFRKRMVAAYEEQGCETVVCSADDYFTEQDSDTGEESYHFDPAGLPDAHRAYKEQFFFGSRRAKDIPALVVVDNTNTQAWEMAFYVELALLDGFDTQIIHRDTPLSVCLARQTHNVPESVVTAMVRRWEDELPASWPEQLTLDDEGAEEYLRGLSL